jgi:hypothetical protein
MKNTLAALLLAVALPVSAQDARTWLESQNLESADIKTFEDLEIAVARVKGARVIMADKARHFIMFDDPSFMFAALDQFLGGR